MDEYKAPYLTLFNGVSDLIDWLEPQPFSEGFDALSALSSTLIRLRTLQCEAEEAFLAHTTSPE